MATNTTGRFASHDPRMISVFEIVGAYFVDVYFNHIYAGARSNLTNGSSLTDEYIRRIQAYVIGVKNDEACYGDTVQGVHRFFTGTTRYTALTFADFVDRIVGVCVPEDYFRQFTPQDKDELLSSILCDLVSNLAAFATKPDTLRRVIDEHDRTPDVTIRMLQDAAVNALIAKRASLYNKFLRKMGQARDHVSMDVVDDMKKALRRLAKEKAEAVARADDAEEALEALKKEVRDSKVREAKLRKLVDLLRAGRDQGAAAAGAGLRIPPRETIAEDPLDFQPQNSRVPRRERIAEPRDEEEDEDDEDDEDDDEDEEDERPRSRGGKGGRAPAKTTNTRGGKPAAPATPAVTASFFRTGGAPLSSGVGTVTAAQLGQRAPTASRASTTTSAPAARPTMLANLMDNVVDAPTGDQDIDAILYGTVQGK